MKSTRIILYLKHGLLNKWSVLTLLLILPSWLIAQNPASGDGNGIQSTAILYGLIIVLLIIIIFALAFMSNALIKLNKYIIEKESGKTIDVSFIPHYHSGGISGLWRKMSGAVPVSAEQDIMFDHDYDGIRELDNQLPPWWKYMFYLCILYAIGYLAVYHVFGIGKSSTERYEAEMSKAEADIRANRANSPKDLINEDNVVQLTDEASLNQGKSFFKANCVACHAEGGAGNVGPNLTDEYWIHGGGIKNVFHTITNGVPEKGMIAWKTQFSPAQIQSIASYVLSLQGSNPPNPKEPQGDIWIAPDNQEPLSNNTDSVSMNNNASTMP